MGRVSACQTGPATLLFLLTQLHCSSETPERDIEAEERGLSPAWQRAKEIKKIKLATWGQMCKTLFFLPHTSTLPFMQVCPWRGEATPSPQLPLPGQEIKAHLFHPRGFPCAFHIWEELCGYCCVKPDGLIRSSLKSWTHPALPAFRVEGKRTPTVCLRPPSRCHLGRSACPFNRGSSQSNRDNIQATTSTSQARSRGCQQHESI